MLKLRCREVKEAYSWYPMKQWLDWDFNVCLSGSIQYTDCL